jgi:N-acetylneuraminic acid mutarotase
MKKKAFILVMLCAATLLSADDQKKIPPMPAAVSGNAVAVLENGLEIVSLMGIGPKRKWNDVTNKVFIMSLSHPKWREGRTVPGVAGRVNAAAIGAKNLVILMGGFVVDNQGAELTLPDVNVYEGSARRWSRGKDIPVAVDSAVAGVIRNRFIYLIGGRSRTGPVNNVQVYDLEKDTWTQATPFPGTPVFGLSGGVADETIVIVDGAKPGPTGGPKFVASDECWQGKIDKKDPNKIEWSKLPPHPGTARFGIAGGGNNRDHKILFS